MVLELILVYQRLSLIMSSILVEERG
ncbi:hypothetical protein LINGRAHAP2_LOCUS34856 [Linum grandiflorum]